MKLDSGHAQETTVNSDSTHLSNGASNHIIQDERSLDKSIWIFPTCQPKSTRQISQKHDRTAEAPSIPSLRRGSAAFVADIKRRISLIIPGLDNEEVACTRGLWDAFDTDRDGFIDFNDFCLYSCDLIQQSKTISTTPFSFVLIELKLIRIFQLELVRCDNQLDVALGNIFTKVDRNHSGRISYHEFQTGVTELGLKEFNYEVHGHKRRFATTSLIVLNVQNRFRYALVWFIVWKWFDRFILGCILFSSIVLGVRDHADPGETIDSHGSLKLNSRNAFVERCELIFTIVFAAECMMKIVAMGFVFGHGAYLQSAWNILDFFVVIAGLIGDLPGVPKLLALRTCRLLRPLRTLTNLRGMRNLVYALISSIPALINVMIVLFFVFAIFGVLGVSMWNGVLYYRCRETPAPVNGIWSLTDDGHVCGGNYKCPSDQYCGSVYDPPLGSSVNFSILPVREYWDHALTNFDHIGHALLTLFQGITLEGWTSVMYNYQDASSWYFATFYFIVYTIVGAFFLLQFVFAVIWEHFTAANDGTSGSWDAILLAAQPVSSSRTTFTLVKSGFLKTTRIIPLANGQDQGSVLKKSPSFQKNMQKRLINPSGKITIWHRLRSICATLVNARWFSALIIFCILLNTICLSLDQYPVNATRDAFTEKVNSILTFIFLIEFALKAVGFGWKSLKQDGYALFDGVIIIFSVTEFITNQTKLSHKSNGISALRTLRLFRVLKLAGTWNSFRKLLQTIASSVADVASFGLFLLLIMYVFALIGMQFFANKYRFDNDGNYVKWEPHIYNSTVPPHAFWTPERPYTIRRSNFDDILSAFTTVFQCLTEENWTAVMADGVHAVGWSASFYFVAVMIFGNIVILNLFLAILLNNFSVEESQQETGEAIVKGKEVIAQTKQSILRQKTSAVMPQSTSPEACSNATRVKKSLGRDAAKTNKSYVIPTKHRPRRVRKRSSGSSHYRDQPERKKAVEGQIAPLPVGSDIPGDSNPSHGAPPKVTKTGRSIADFFRDRSLCIFSRKNVFRRHICAVVHHRYTENLLLSLILLSSILLAADNPLDDPNSSLSRNLIYFDRAFTWLFSAEMIFKVIDRGVLCNGPESYLRDPWNVLDSGTLIASLVTLFSGDKALQSIRSLRTLRALRPLRVIGRFPSMRRVVYALLSSIPYIFNVSLVCILIFFSFGIIGVNLFKGRLFACDFSTFSAEKMLYLEATFGFTKLSFKKLFSRQDCSDHDGRWYSKRRNYNNILKSAMTLFEIASTEGWVDIMYEGVDATEIGYHPVQNWNREYIVFFIVFMIIGSFFSLNLFVGAVIDNFNRMRETLSDDAFTNDSQRDWLRIQESIKAIRFDNKEVPPKSLLRLACYRIIRHPWVENLFILCVVLNPLILAITHFGESKKIAYILQLANVVFGGVFFLEVILKLLAYGKPYLRDPSNWFDCLIGFGSMAISLPLLIIGDRIAPIANALRACRMGLAIRLMKRARSMQDIVTTILDNMPALINVSTLMFLIMFVYGVMGVQLYAGVMLGRTLDEHANFKSIKMAMVTLFRFTTGEAWNDVMYDLMVQPMAGEAPYPYGQSCVEDYTFQMLEAARNYTKDPNLTIGCSPGISITYIYFVSYMLLTTYVLLNLFVAVILEGFEVTNEKNAAIITTEDIEHVLVLWKQYDTQHTGRLDDHSLIKVMCRLPPPLGLPKSSSHHEIINWAMTLPLQLDAQGRISITAFLYATAHHVMERIAKERSDTIQQPRKIALYTQQSQSSSFGASLRVYLSIKRIQSAVRRLLAKKRVERLRAQRGGAFLQVMEELEQDPNNEKMR
uniref:Uncharacterized protein AlNc14C187G8356 n=1 Tax=Albugo laibachii Nc14 TaxID=890382 RepID=F0WPL1_9STRA|nr:hypothetical protein ALNC14_094040 [Albugo laibachii Nc14]|eukprot:CCA23261.1 hypothetical protein ALNC14_094040 [Albugo laibachii Nc14]